MSKLLLGFKDYDDGDIQFLLDGPDALRVVNEVMPSMTSCNSSVTVIVTIFPRGLDNEGSFWDHRAGATTGGDAGTQHTLELDGR